VAINPASAWNHGDVSPDINTTWLGIAGPGVNRGGVDSQTWADHTDVRPTLMALTGLRDDYSADGRVLFELMSDQALGSNIADQRQLLTDLARDYKRINAPVGELGLSTLAASTDALASGDSGQIADSDAALDDIAAQRGDIAGRMRQVLEAAVFSGQRADAAAVGALRTQAQGLLDSAAALPHGAD
jgi:hypothetical protein